MVGVEGCAGISEDMKTVPLGPARTGSASGNWQPCNLNSKGFAHIKAMLTGIYGDSAGSVLREYVANAIDTQAEVGCSEPVQVNLPTALRPVVAVSDHGTGLTEEEVRSVFADYGNSTKGQSNDYIGAFGIGSKSAFAVSSSFTVKAVKDGVKTVTVFSMHNGEPGHEVVARVATTERNGVTIEIPVSPLDTQRWCEAAAETLSWFPPEQVSVSGSDVTWQLAGALKIGSSAWLMPKPMRAPFMVLIGGAPCPGSTVLATTKPLMHHKLVLDLPIGSVDLLPNREGLRDTPRTRAALAEAVKTARKAAEEAFVAATAAAHTVMDKVAVSLEYADASQVFDFSAPMPEASPISLGGLVQSVNYLGHLTPTALTPDVVTSAVFVDVEGKSFESIRRASRSYLNPWRNKMLLLHDGTLPAVDWFDPQHSVVQKITGSQIRAAVAQPPRQRAELRYSEHGTDKLLTVSEVRADTRQVILADTRPDLLDTLQPGWQAGSLVLSLTGNQTMAAALARFPAALRVSDLIRQACEANPVSETELRALAASRLPRTTKPVTRILSKLTPGTPQHDAYTLLLADLQIPRERLSRAREIASYTKQPIPKHPAEAWPALLWAVKTWHDVPDVVLQAIVQAA